MELKVNGSAEQCADGNTVEQLLSAHSLDTNVTGIAVAVNSSIVPRSDWNSRSLRDGDVVEIIHAVQGG